MECKNILAPFSMLIRDFFIKDSDIVPEAATLLILVIKSAVFMSNNGKDNKHTTNIDRRVHFMINGDKCKLHKIDWCEGGLQLSKIATKNVGDNGLNPKK